MTGTLPDGTAYRVFPLCACGHDPCRGGQHAGHGPVAVVLVQGARRLRLHSGMRSRYKTQTAVEGCSCWAEVPLAIEAVEWVSLPNAPAGEAAQRCSAPGCTTHYNDCTEH